MNYVNIHDNLTILEEPQITGSGATGHNTSN